jgi:hypothetical protein
MKMNGVKISRNEGVRGIYKEYRAALASVDPFSALYFFFNEECKQTVTALGSFSLTPLDMAKSNKGK